MPHRRLRSHCGGVNLQNIFSGDCCGGSGGRTDSSPVVHGFETISRSITSWWSRSARLGPDPPPDRHWDCGGRPPCWYSFLRVPRRLSTSWWVAIPFLYCLTMADCLVLWRGHWWVLSSFRRG